MSVVDDIKNQIDIVELVSENVKLRRTGKNYIGFCPFHANTRTPAFVVFPDSGSWKCFGQCAEGGDIFNYVMKRDNCDFQQALETLAKKAGIELKPYQHEEQHKNEEQKHLYEMMEEAVEYYHNNLTQHPAGQPALAYLAKRGLTAETIEKFKLGYAHASWDALIQHLLSKGYSREDLIATGMASEKRTEAGEVIPDGRIFDRFRNRIMIPIRDSRGNPIGFGARILDPNDSPKFLNSPQTVLFDKGKTVFALNDAKRSIREKNQVVIVEGYMDVIVLHQAGFTNTVSPMGTALTDFQVRQLTRQTKRIVLALDADAAGDHAAIRGIDVIRSVMLGAGENVQDGQSLIHQENKMNADIRVTRIPDGMDPDEVVLRNPEEWEQILANAKPIVIHMMETLSAGRDLDDAKTRSEIAEQILPLIQEIPNAIERETYRQQLARHLRIDESLLGYSTKKAAPVAGARRAFPDKPRLEKKSSLIFDPKDSFYNKETEILRCLYHYYDTPGAISSIDRALRSFRLEPLNPADFEQSDLHEIAVSYFSAIDQDEELNTRRFIDESIPEPIRETFEKLKNKVAQGFVEMDQMNDDIARSIAFMRQEKCEYLKSGIQALLSDGETDAENVSDYENLLDQTVILRRNLDMIIENLNKIDFQNGKKQ